MANRRDEHLDQFARIDVEDGQQEASRVRLAISVLAILRGRGLAISDDQYARIMGAADAATLQTWLSRAFDIDNTEQIFD